MSQKAPLPSLTGHRLKTRKRDEKKQYDPIGFRDAVLEGLEGAGEDLEAVTKFLDSAGSKLDYRRYGEALVEILLAGGLLGTFHYSIFISGFSIPFFLQFLFSPTKGEPVSLSLVLTGAKPLHGNKVYLDNIVISFLNLILQPPGGSSTRMGSFSGPTPASLAWLVTWKRSANSNRCSSSSCAGSHTHFHAVHLFCT